MTFQETFCFTIIGEIPAVSAGDAVLLHEFAGEYFTRFELSCSFSGTENGNSCSLQLVDYSRGKRGLGAYYNKVNSELFRFFHDSGNIGG